MNTSDSIGQSIGQPPSGPKHRTAAGASDNQSISPGHTIGQSIGRNGHLGASDTATPLRGVAGAPTTPLRLSRPSAARLRGGDDACACDASRRSSSVTLADALPDRVCRGSVGVPSCRGHMVGPADDRPRILVAVVVVDLEAQEPTL
jgi:hypothetical protein